MPQFQTFYTSGIVVNKNNLVEAYPIVAHIMIEGDMSNKVR